MTPLTIPDIEAFGDVLTAIGEESEGASLPRDGWPRRGYSTRQRTLVLTFDTPEAAERFDAMSDRQVADLFASTEVVR